jgi:molybdate transport system substrate-binding protein
MELRVVGGGAAQGLVGALTQRFEAAHPCRIVGTFSAVGAMRDRIVAGEPADVAILSRALITELIGSGHVVAADVGDVGAVLTGLAVRIGDAVPRIEDAASLAAALAAADAIYMPDPRLATAGIHFAKVLAQVAPGAATKAKLKAFPNGTTAMRALATADGRPIGCTQITEILATPGVALVGPLPKAFELATVYTAAVCAKSAAPNLAAALITLLAGEETRPLRRQLGFTQAL